MKYEEVLDKIESVLQGQAHLDELAKRKRDPFKILISTILSARTRDANTRAATEKLFAKYNKPQLIAEANLEDLEELIRLTGFYKVKAARIKEVSKIIHEKYNGKVPEDFDELINLPGVGAKTANCVLIYAFNIDTIAVDTHVHRVSNRLRWVDTKKPEETEEALKNLIPKKEWKRINRIFVKFGQQICLPINPKHNLCPIEDICPKDFSMEIAKKKKKKNNS
ncbi:MAG: endonuclease III [Promethearchaeota archaeon]|nr:MAG: endonuclease III [Candidatus Lokiarchaeota archaeon]